MINKFLEDLEEIMQKSETVSDDALSVEDVVYDLDGNIAVNEVEQKVEDIKFSIGELLTSIEYLQDHICSLIDEWKAAEDLNPELPFNENEEGNNPPEQGKEENEREG